MIQSPDPVYRNRATLAGLLVRPKQQSRAAMAFAAATWVVASAFAGILVANLDELTPTFILIAVSAMALILTVFALVTGILLSHRIFGPIVSIKRHIASLREGEYSHRLQLRQTDDLSELKAALNDLAQALEQRHGPGRKGPT